MKYLTLKKYCWILTAVILLIGFVLMQINFVDYGYAFFILFPLFLGFAIGTLFKNGFQILYLTIGIVVGSLALLMFGIEGFVCVLMLLPIFIFSVWLGYFISKRLKMKVDSDTQKVMVSVLPLIVLLGAGHLEKMIDLEPQKIEIVSSKLLDYTPEIVFDEVKAMEKLDAEKSLLMKLGLPTPIRCELKADTVGALRHCIFENGAIIAQLTKYEKGKILEMNVVDYTLTGRHWFKFIDANYTFEESEGKTKITRTSSYTSILKPRWYWEPLEKYGIEKEHEFVLSSLKKNIKEKYDR